MGKIDTRLPGFCLNRIRPRVRVRPPPIQAKPDLNSTKNDQNNENTDSVVGDQEKPGNSEGKPVELIGRKIMIVVDSSIEAQGALQWALSHTVQSQDLLILLHVTKESFKQVLVGPEPGKKAMRQKTDPRHCANQSSNSSFFVSSRHVWTISTGCGPCGSLCFTNLFRPGVPVSVILSP